MVNKMSLWEKDINDIHFNSLNKNIETDILIIGGGITGLTTLYYLKDYQSICLVEKNTIGCGVTKNTTGKITYLQGAIHVDLMNNINYEVASLYLKSQITAISLIKKIIKKEKISCNLEQVSSFLHAEKKKDFSKLEAEKNFLLDNYIPVQEHNHAISVVDTYVFNPEKYLNGLKNILQNKTIYEHTNITNITFKNGKYYCNANSSLIIAKKVIIACHYPFFLFPFCLPLKSHIEKSYLIAYKTTTNEHNSGITISNPGYSYRYYQDGKAIYKICLASSHRSTLKQNDKDNFLNVQKKFHIPSDKIVAKWSNVDIITEDKLPFIDEIKNNMYIATGFNTWGMTNGILAAKILSDKILNKENEFAPLFKIQRKNFYKVKSFFSNTFFSIYGFINSHCFKKWYPNTLHFIKNNGQKIAIYVDQNNKRHSVYPICPHLKCGLIFNEEEKTWDCPCHSSRFDLDGNCIKGPSTKNISCKK